MTISSSGSSRTPSENFFAKNWESRNVTITSGDHFSASGIFHDLDGSNDGAGDASDDPLSQLIWSISSNQSIDGRIDKGWFYKFDVTDNGLRTVGSKRSDSTMELSWSSGVSASTSSPVPTVTEDISLSGFTQTIEVRSTTEVETPVSVLGGLIGIINGIIGGITGVLGGLFGGANVGGASEGGTGGASGGETEGEPQNSYAKLTKDENQLTLSTVTVGAATTRTVASSQSASVTTVEMLGNEDEAHAWGTHAGWGIATDYNASGPSESLIITRVVTGTTATGYEDHVEDSVEYDLDNRLLMNDRQWSQTKTVAHRFTAKVNPGIPILTSNRDRETWITRFEGDVDYHFSEEYDEDNDPETDEFYKKTIKAEQRDTTSWSHEVFTQGKYGQSPRRTVVTDETDNRYFFKSDTNIEWDTITLLPDDQRQTVDGWDQHSEYYKQTEDSILQNETKLGKTKLKQRKLNYFERDREWKAVGVTSTHSQTGSETRLSLKLDVVTYQKKVNKKGQTTGSKHEMGFWYDSDDTMVPPGGTVPVHFYSWKKTNPWPNPGGGGGSGGLGDVDESYQPSKAEPPLPDPFLMAEQWRVLAGEQIKAFLETSPSLNPQSQKGQQLIGAMKPIKVVEATATVTFDVLRPDSVESIDGAPHLANQAFDPTGGYWYGVGQVFLGYGDFIYGVGEGAIQLSLPVMMYNYGYAILHPEETLLRISDSINHIPQLPSAIYNDIVNKSGTLRGQGEITAGLISILLPLSKLKWGANIAPNRLAALESKLASRTMTQAEWKELSQLRRIIANDLQQISRWGRPGLQNGDWVMKGSPNWANYFFSFKWQPGMTNKFSPFRSGETFFVPKDFVRWPSGLGY